MPTENIYSGKRIGSAFSPVHAADKPALIALPDDNNRNIEAIRGFAAILVCYFHLHVIAWIGVRGYWHAFGAKPSFLAILSYLSFPVVWGSIGVPIFFVISGYCIHLSHAQRLAKTPSYRLKVREFLQKRVIRIYPVLIVALLSTLVLDTLSMQYSPFNERLGSLGVASFLTNLFALQGIVGPTYGSNGALWTLSVEIQFYLFYPLLFIFLKRFGRNVTFVALLALGLVSYFVFERNGIVVFLSYWFSWYLGAYIAELKIRGEVKASSGSLWFVAAALLALGCVVTFKSEFAAFQIWAVSFSLALVCILRRPAGNSLLVRCLEKLGAFSYSLYIIHLPVGVYLTSAIFHSVKPSNILYSIGFTFVAVACAFIFYLGVERPVILYMKAKRRVNA